MGSPQPSEASTGVPSTLTINDLDDNSLMVYFENLPDLTAVLEARKVCTRWRDIGRKYALTRQSLVIIDADNYSDNFKRVPDDKIIDPSADPNDAQLDAVATRNADFQKSDQIRLREGDSWTSLIPTLIDLFPNITELVLVIDAVDLHLHFIAITDLLDAYAHQLESLKLHIIYSAVNDYIETDPRVIHERATLLQLINNTLPRLRILHIDMPYRFLRTNYCTFNLPIIEQLDEFKFYSVDGMLAMFSTLKRYVMANLRRSNDPPKLQLSLMSLTPTEEIFEQFDNVTAEEMNQFLASIKALNLFIGEQFLSSGYRLRNLKTLVLNLDDHIVDVCESRSRLLRTLAQLPSLLELLISNLYFKAYNRLCAADAELPDDEQQVIVPSIRYLGIFIMKSLEGKFANHNTFLAQFRFHECFPSLRAAQVNVAHFQKPCAACRASHPNVEWTKELSEFQCFLPMLEPLKSCPQICRLFCSCFTGLVRNTPKEEFTFPFPP